MPNKKLVLDAYTHDLLKLVGLSGLKVALDSDTKLDGNLAINWAIVKDWDETARYRLIGQNDAEDLVAAVSNRRHGVMKWVRKHW